MAIATVIVIVWCAFLGYTYTNFIKVDEIIIDEMLTYSRHTGQQVDEVFTWFEESQKVFVPTDLSGNENPNIQTSITSTGGQSFAMPLPIVLAGRLESKIQKGTNLRFVSNTPLNSKNTATSDDNRALMNAIDAGSVDFFGKNDDDNSYKYVRPMLATKSCLNCHTTLVENGLIGALVIDIDPSIFTSSDRYSRQNIRLISVIGSFLALVLLYLLLIDIWRKQRSKSYDLKSSQSAVTNMSQEIELVLSNMNSLLKELQQGGDRPQMNALVQSLQNINKNLLDTSFKIRTGKSGIQHQDEIFDVDELFEECAQMILPQCNEKNVKLTMDIATSVPTHLLGNAYHLRQAVGRLLGFSALYTKKGNIAVRIRSTMNMPSRFYAKDLNYIPMHLIIEIEDTSMGYVVTDKQSLLQNFADKMGQNKMSHTRPIISLTPVNEIASFMYGQVSMSSNSRKGACFKLVVQMKLVDNKSIASLQSSTKPYKRQNEASVTTIRTPEPNNISTEQMGESGNIVMLDTPVSVILASSEVETIPENHVKMFNDAKANILHVKTGTEIFHALDKPDHGYSVVILRKLSDMETSFCATRIRYVEHENSIPVSIVIISEDMVQTDLEVMRFFNVSTADNIPKDPEIVLKIINLALVTRNNKLFQDGKILSQTIVDADSTKLFDVKKALANTKNDKKLLHSICSMWLRFYPKQMERCQMNIKEGSHEHKLRLLRSIKNSASTVSLPMLWAEADRLEERLKQGEDVRFEKLMLIYENTYEYMKSKFS